MRITEIFETRGFVAYPFEFWHYSKGDVFETMIKGDESPSIYGPVDWNSETRNITPVDNPLKLLNSEDDIKQMTIKMSRKALK